MRTAGMASALPCTVTICLLTVSVSAPYSAATDRIFAVVPFETRFVDPPVPELAPLCLSVRRVSSNLRNAGKAARCIMASARHCV